MCENVTWICLPQCRVDWRNILNSSKSSAFTKGGEIFEQQKKRKICKNPLIMDNMKLLLIRILLLLHSFMFFRFYFFLSMYIWFYSCL